jgi:hypothetical protein
MGILGRALRTACETESFSAFSSRKIFSIGKDNIVSTYAGHQNIRASG